MSALKETVNDLKEIEDSFLIVQFQVPCHSLNTECMANAVLENEEKLISMSQLIISKLLSSENDLYKNCEFIMHGLVVASLMYSVESVVESIVSGFESHFGPKRTMTDEHTMDEMTIYINGPDLANCNFIVKTPIYSLRRT